MRQEADEEVRCVVLHQQGHERPSLSDSLSSGRCLFVCVCNIVCLSRIGIDVYRCACVF